MVGIESVIKSVIDGGFESIFDEPQPPSQIKRATLDELEITHPKICTVIECVRAWQSEKRNGRANASLVIVGPYGTGKTHIARAILWSICHCIDGHPVAPVGRFFMATDLMMKMGSDSGQYAHPGTIIGESPIIVIDDIGTEQELHFVAARKQDWERRKRYFNVINYCYKNGISVIMTGNIEIPKIVDVIGGRAWDRLCEMAPRGFMIDMSGVPSLRQMRSGRA